MVALTFSLVTRADSLVEKIDMLFDSVIQSIYQRSAITNCPAHLIINIKRFKSKTKEQYNEKKKK